MKSLRIAQLVLPWIALPPRGYAGTERVVYNLTEELVRRGHDVTLFASGDSHTSARLSSVVPQALGLQSDVHGALTGSLYPLMHVARCFQMADQFDVIHSHAQFLGLPFAAASKTPSVHTFHRELTFQKEDETALVNGYKHLNFTSISNAQRTMDLNFIATVYNGVDTSAYKPVDAPTRDYVFWAGRLIDKKGPKEAILVALRLGMPLVLAGKKIEERYFSEQIAPFVDGKQVRCVDDISTGEMIKLYQNAKLTIVPIKWNEPFGLVPVESMACGTPVVAYKNGGVAETIADGTGYLVSQHEGVEGLVAKAKEIIGMDSESYARLCHNARKHVEEHFSVASMVSGYERVYEHVTKN